MYFKCLILSCLSDIPQVVILSKVDSICEATKDDPANAFRSQKVEKCVAKVKT
jgi:hypothetical protein